MIRRHALFLVAAALAAACTNEPAGPQPGTLSVKLTTPNSGADGAMLFTLTGPAAPANLTAASGDTLWGGPFTTSANQIVLTGPLASGTVLTFSVPDVTVSSQYAATVGQVAASSGYALRSLSGYSLAITR